MTRFASALVNYLKASIEELQKVAWPTRTETIRYSTLTVGIVLALALVIGLFDFALTIGFEKIIAFLE